MSVRGEQALLRAIDAARRDGAWLSDVRRGIPSASSTRVLFALAALKREGLIAERSGAYKMATYTLTAAGKERLRRRSRRT